MINKNISEKIHAFSLTKKFTGIFDPLKVIETHKSQEMLLLESADVITKLGEKSMLLMDLALKIEARNNQIAVSALLPQGQLFISKLKDEFSKHIKISSTDSVIISMDPLFSCLDLLEKMRLPSALDVLRLVMKLIVCHSNTEKNLMLAGVFSYDFIDHFEKLPAAKKDMQKFPDFLFYLPLSLVVIDHKSQTTSVYAHDFVSNKCDYEEKNLFDMLECTAQKVQQAMDKDIVLGKKLFAKPTHEKSYDIDISDDDFSRLVEHCQEYIKKGDVYQIVPSRTFSCPITNAHESYRVLRQMNPSPYMFFLATSDWTLFGASPETYIKVDKSGTRLSIRPIAGTRLRGLDSTGAVNDELDAREQASLCLDEKELAEHMMLVDLARNDVASVCIPKSRKITKLLSVDHFSHVMHLVSQVEGDLLKDFDALSAYQASINMGTLMGAPKVRAAEILRNVELTKRGCYGGAVGYLDIDGDMDTAIIIRSALVLNGHAYIRAGCGVVYDSDAVFETNETTNKATAVLRAIELANKL